MKAANHEVLKSKKLEWGIEKTKWIKIQRAQTELKAMKNGSREMDDVEVTHEEISKVTSIPVEEVVVLLFKMPRASNMLRLDFQYKGTSRSGAEQDSSSIFSTSIYRISRTKY